MLLNATLNVELVYIILKSITRFSFIGLDGDLSSTGDSANKNLKEIKVQIDD